MAGLMATTIRPEDQNLVALALLGYDVENNVILWSEATQWSRSEIQHAHVYASMAWHVMLDAFTINNACIKSVLSRT